MEIVLKLVNNRGRVIWHAYKDGDGYRIEHDEGKSYSKEIDDLFYINAMVYFFAAPSSKAEGKLAEEFNRHLTIMRNSQCISSKSSLLKYMDTYRP